MVLGVGAGDSETEHENFGFPTDRLVSRFEEAMQIIAPLVRKRRLDGFRGDYYDVHDVAFQPTGPSVDGTPILVGSLGGPRMMRLTARFADIWTASLPATNGTLKGYTDASRRFDLACEEEQRDPASVTRMVEVVVRVPDGPPSIWWEGHTIEGSTESIAEDLSHFREAGADQIMLWIEPNNTAGIDALAETVRLAKNM